MEKDVNETININTFTKEDWTFFIENLYTHSNADNKNRSIENSANMGNEINEHKTTVQQIIESMNELKKRKEADEDDISNELIKYDRNVLTTEMQKLFDEIITKMTNHIIEKES